MKMIIATSDFKIRGTPYPGFPLLYDNNHQLVKAPHRFLIKQCVVRGRAASVKTWKQYGFSLYDYFDYLEVNYCSGDSAMSLSHAWKIGCGSDSDSCDVSVLGMYRDWLLRARKCGGQGLAISTVNDRLRQVIRFYQHAVRMHWIVRLPFDVEDIKINKPKGFLAHTDTSQSFVSSPDILLRNRRTEVKVLSRSQIDEFLAGINNRKHLLFARLALGSGMRREELNTFPLKYVSNPAYLPINNHWVRIHLNPRDMKLKGEQPRKILIRRGLMEDLWQYAIHDRPVLEELSGSRQSVFFLNQSGEPYQEDHSSIAESWKRLGLPFRVNLHTLRHTYATHTLYSLNRLKAEGKYFGDPLMFVRDRLGHRSILTTMKYLHVMNDLDVEDLIFNHDLDLEEISMDEDASDQTKKTKK